MRGVIRRGSLLQFPYIKSLALLLPQMFGKLKNHNFRWTISDDSPGEIYNWTLYASVLVFGILGAARGFDEGCVSGTVTQPSFKARFGLEDKTKTESEIAQLKSNITSMVQLGSIAGSALAMVVVDRLGRKRSLQLLCVLWIVGVIIQITSTQIGQLYAGRLLEGVAVGQTTVCGPTYIAEVAPKSIRGLCSCIFAGSVYLGITIAYFGNVGTALHYAEDDQKLWIIPNSVKIILAGLLLLGGTFLCVESPRWLFKVGQTEKATANLVKLRNLPESDPFIAGEIDDITAQITLEKAEAASLVSVLKDFFVKKSLAYRLALCLAIQVLGQWSGANAFTIYAPEFFALVGESERIQQLIMTATFGIVKLCSAYFCAFFVIDMLGRRRALYIGIVIQLVATLFFALYLVIVPEAAEKGVSLTGSQVAAGKGAMAMIYLSGVGWTMGFNAVQYLFNAEVFPLRSRNVAVSLIMVFHFANQYGNSKAVPLMLLAMDNYGAFFFFAAVLVIGLATFWFFLPEVSGRSLESMEELFNLPWYLIGRRGAQLCPDYSESARRDEKEAKEVEAEWVEISKSRESSV